MRGCFMDISYLLFLQDLRSFTHGIFDSLFLCITTWGEELILLFITAGIYWCLNKQLGIYLLFNFHIGNLVNQCIKLTACVYRPWIRDGRIQPVEAAKPAATGYSFPSGHTAKATAIWGGLSYGGFRGKKAMRNLLISIVLLVGFSRNYLGVHTPQDVVISWGLGLILLIAVNYMLKWTEQGRHRDVVVCGIGILLSIILLIYAVYKTYPMDYVEGQLLVDSARMVGSGYKSVGGAIGFFSGWLWERRYICFDEKSGTWETKLLRFLIGAGGLLILFKVTPAICFLLFGGLWGNFINAGAMAIYITAIFPWLYMHRRDKLNY